MSAGTVVMKVKDVRAAAQALYDEVQRTRERFKEEYLEKKREEYIFTGWFKKAKAGDIYSDDELLKQAHILDSMGWTVYGIDSLALAGGILSAAEFDQNNDLDVTLSLHDMRLLDKYQGRY